MASTTKMSINFDLRVVIGILLVVIIGMLAAWRPWSSSNTTDRVITVTGQATIKAEPDEFVFYPAYEFKNANKQAALDTLTAKSNELVTKLKALGLNDSQIKTNSDGYDNYYYFAEDTKTNNYTLRLTVTVNSKDQAQKVQDYLVTTSPSGAVSPQATFSENLRKQLEQQARDEATKDARAKAEQSAGNLGFKIGKVKSIEDGTGFGGVIPYGRDMMATSAIAEDSKQSLAVQPGQNDLSYSVTVIYYIR